MNLESENDSAVDVSVDSVYASSPCEENNQAKLSFLSVFDVYDIAASIGHEFKIIIDKHGHNSIGNLMPKVIHILEELKNYSSRLNAEENELSILQTAVERLEIEKLERVQDRLRYDKDILKIEETWRSETNELRQIIKTLNEQNSKLITIIQNSLTSTMDPGDIIKDVNDEEVRLMVRLKAIIDHQKVELRAITWQLSQKSMDLDAMQQQANRLAKLNASLRRKHGVSKRLALQLAEDKIELETRLQSKEQLVQEMSDHVYHSLKLGNNFQIDNSTSTTISRSASIGSDPCSSPINPISQLTEERLIKLLNSEGKMIPTSRHPYHPCFTVDELRKVFIECNELKSQIIEVVEELSAYEKSGDNDLVVQGPINCEPFEKVNYDQYHQMSKIKKILHNLLHR